MGYSYILLEPAQEEYESAVNWYIENSIPAAEGFVKSVEQTLELICEHPDRWRNEYNKYYELSVKKYPYSIVYIIRAKEELIVVTSVFHHSRNPKKKYKK